VRRLALTAGLVAVLAWAPGALAQDQEPGDAHGDHETTAHEGGEHHGGPLNWTHFGAETIPLVAMLLNFSILVGLLVFLGRKKLGEYLKARHLAVQDALTEAQQTRAEAEKRYREYSARLEQLDRELTRLREEIKNAAQAERDRIVAEAEERAARLQRETDFLLGQELKQVRIDLERELATAAVSAAEEVLRKAANEGDQVRLAEGVLSSLEAPTKGGQAS